MMNNKIYFFVHRNILFINNLKKLNNIHIIIIIKYYYKYNNILCQKNNIMIE